MALERYMVKELELSRRHEEIIMQREALLRGTETYFDIQEAKSSSFIVDYGKAMERNHLLMKDINEAIGDLKQEAHDPGTRDPKFHTLKNNYWTMVRNVFPVWYEELQDYEKRRGVKTTGPGSFSNQNVQVPKPQLSVQNPVRSIPVSSGNKLARSSQDEVDDTTLVSVPPLDLDFSLTDDVTSRSAITPKLTSSGKAKSGKKVHYDEDSLRSTSRSKSAPHDNEHRRKSSLSPSRDGRLFKGYK